MLVVGDGLAGYEGNAEYDRLIATCSVRYIPIPWLWQVRDGGAITAPLSGWMGGVAFAHLTVAEDGTASGRFLEDDVYFMTALTAHPRCRLPFSGSGTAGRAGWIRASWTIRPGCSRDSWPRRRL
ncbi:hypothetical protein ACFQVD_36200 [Streptosporangium amethystogenes subsp. fukuiense]|uniref:Uncharacterized protein n=1 Tax=Streptosporangium amethystogenes subsp. fukuiense TaxID=698418 RepID=A0ABW2TA27_9ACTN